MVGVGITIFDLTSASRHLQKFLKDEPPVKSRSSASATGSGGTPPTVDQRVDALEDWKRSELPGELDRLYMEIHSLITTVANNTYGTFMDRWRHIKDYLRGGHQGLFRRYLGPIVVGVGILLGLAGNALNIYALSAH
jgi:hypothetical protein